MTGPGVNRTREPLKSDGQQGSGAGPRNTAPEKVSTLFGLDGADDQPSGQPDRHAQLRSGVIFPMNQFNKPIKPTDINRRLELPPDAYRLNNEYKFEQPLPIRPGWNTDGKQILVRVNQFKVLDWPDKVIYQYDVSMNLNDQKKRDDPSVDSRGLVKAVWNTTKVQNKLKESSNFWLWNGDKIAWSDQKIERNEIKMQINMDAERGRTPKAGAPPNVVWFHMRQTTKIQIEVIKAYLDGRNQFDNSVLEAINFLDHLMRVTPSKKYVQIKRSYFTPGTEMKGLDDTIQAMKGVYASMRLCENSGGSGTGLSVNVDVANGTFWTPLMMHIMSRNLTAKHGNKTKTMSIFGQMAQTVVIERNTPTQSPTFKELRKLNKIKFTVQHRGKMGNDKVYSLKGFVWEPENGRNVDANTKTFHILKKGTKGTPNPVIERTISIAEYFRERYNILLQFPYLPLVESVKGGIFPMELCKIIDNQRYMFKTDSVQTAEMIKFAVTRPEVRMAAIGHGISKLDWANDPELRNMGIKISTQMTVSKARLLAPPEIKFASSKISPGTKGKWDLRGHKFFKTPGPKDPLKSWGFAIMEECCQESVVRNFATALVKQYVLHGGSVETKEPLIIRPGQKAEADSVVPALYKRIGEEYKKAPQIMFFVMLERNSAKYERIKKSADCRFGVVSQVVNAKMIASASAQYCSNVLMKVNAKLGGTTSVIAGPSVKQPLADYFPRGRTIILGADVSHPTPGSDQASMASITMSADLQASRYVAAVETNSFNREMISTPNFQKMLIPMLKWWASQYGPPIHIYYFRDGVSEGQYQQVLQMEINDIKTLIKDNFKVDPPKMTAIVCSKRHRIRMFPEKGTGDRNGNPHPGTLVERDVTHPGQYDFYLNSHSAIQGTARPVHYHVVLDEMCVPVNHLQKMIYHQCYQYIRSTTPVSLHPAVYYAHLAASRARAHEAVASSAGPRGGQKFQELDNARRVREAHMPGHRDKPVTIKTKSADAKPLLNMGIECGDEQRHKMKYSMWFV